MYLLFFFKVFAFIVFRLIEIEMEMFNDLIILKNIKENINRGKTYYWWRYASQFFSNFDYIIKTDEGKAWWWLDTGFFFTT